jgi:hypothetical protein
MVKKTLNVRAGKRPLGQPRRANSVTLCRSYRAKSGRDGAEVKTLVVAAEICLSGTRSAFSGRPVIDREPISIVALAPRPRGSLHQVLSPAPTATRVPHVIPPSRRAR